MLGCGVLAVLCGTCPIAQPWGRTAPQQLPGAGRASCARMAGALGAGTVPVPLVAWPWWCPRCQHCPGDRSWAKLMIDPHVTPRPPVPLASPCGAHVTGDGTGPILMEFLWGSQVSCSLGGLSGALSAVPTQGTVPTCARVTPGAGRRSVLGAAGVQDGARQIWGYGATAKWA